MSRYDQAKAKRPASSAFRREAKSRHPRSFVVLLLMGLSACGGFYLAKFSEKYELAPEAYQWLHFGNSNPTLATPAADDTGNTSQPLATNGESLEQLSQPEASVVLPMLDKSDAWVRQALLGLSPGLAPWLGQEQLIRNYLVIAFDFSQGERIGKHVRFLKPEPSFAIAQDGQGLYIAPTNYSRFGRWVAAINVLDTASSLALYKKIRPLLLQAFGELNPNGNLKLEAMLIKASEHILAAPIIDTHIYVSKRMGYYRFADPNLEAASALHKQMLRMGPENTRIIKNKLRQFADGLLSIGDN